MQLRYKVRDFGIQYFSEELPKHLDFKGNWLWKKYMVSVRKDESYLDFVNCSEKRPSIVQAFLWRLIVHKVFSRFRWAGSASQSVSELYRNLELCLSGGQPSFAEVEAIRKVHTWRDTTVSLLLDSMDQKKRSETDSKLQQWRDKFQEDANTNLRELLLKDQGDYQQAFLDIIDEAIKIDMEICRQVSWVTWSFGDDDATQTFDATKMELRKGEILRTSSETTLVISLG